LNLAKQQLAAVSNNETINTPKNVTSGAEKSLLPQQRVRVEETEAQTNQIQPLQPNGGPLEPQNVIVNVHFDTHIYTIRDQPIKIRIWNQE
jgi:hypothetical protein